MVTYLQVPSPLGPLLLTQENEALTGVWFDQAPPPGAAEAASPVLLQARQWLERYFAGMPEPITFPLAPAGTPFQQVIWNLLLDIPYGSPVLLQARQWLERYFAGMPEPITFPLAPAGTPFQQVIWNLLLDIPYGETRTYGELSRQAAKLLGKQRMSAQAVGGAVGRNPISILIPCHRCIGANGKLVGYAAGLGRKAWLLAHESSKNPPPKIF